MHASHSPGNDRVSKLLSVMLTPPLPHPVFDFSSKGVEYSVVCNMKTCNFFLRKHLRAVDCSRKQPPTLSQLQRYLSSWRTVSSVRSHQEHHSEVKVYTLHDLSLSLNSLDRPLQALRSVYTVEASSWRREVWQAVEEEKPQNHRRDMAYLLLAETTLADEIKRDYANGNIIYREDYQRSFKKQVRLEDTKSFLRE